MQCKIDNMPWSFVKSEYVKQKKLVFTLKQTKKFTEIDANTLNIL